MSIMWTRISSPAENYWVWSKRPCEEVTPITELVFILGKSGSMAGLESDTIGGFNAMLQKQRAVDGTCRIATVLFDHSYTLLHN